MGNWISPGRCIFICRSPTFDAHFNNQPPKWKDFSSCGDCSALCVHQSWKQKVSSVNVVLPLQADNVWTLESVTEPTAVVVSDGVISTTDTTKVIPMMGVFKATAVGHKRANYIQSLKGKCCYWLADRFLRTCRCKWKLLPKRSTWLRKNKNQDCDTSGPRLVSAGFSQLYFT